MTHGINTQELEAERDNLYAYKKLYETKKDKTSLTAVKAKIRSINLKLRTYYRNK